jgi:hypothetical protein
MKLNQFAFLGLAALMVAFLPAQEPDTASASSSTAPLTVSTKTGILSSMPKSCTNNLLYIASDQPQGQQLYFCKDGQYYQFLTVGPSGALTLNQGSLDITPGVIPIKTGGNTFTGLNVFSALRIAPQTPGLPCSEPQRDLGNVRMDNSDPDNTKLQFCLVQNGQLQWLTPYLSGRAVWGATQ